MTMIFPNFFMGKFNSVVALDRESNPTKAQGVMMKMLIKAWRGPVPG